MPNRHVQWPPLFTPNNMVDKCSISSSEDIELHSEGELVWWWANSSSVATPNQKNVLLFFYLYIIYYGVGYFCSPISLDKIKIMFSDTNNRSNFKKKFKQNKNILK